MCPWRHTVASHRHGELIDVENVYIRVFVTVTSPESWRRTVRTSIFLHYFHDTFSMAKGLDVGTMNIVSAQRADGTVRFVKERNAFVELDYTELADQMLSRSDIIYTREGDKVRILGDEALSFANIFNTEVERPMSQGILASDTTSGMPMLKTLIEYVVGEPTHPGERLYFTSPANPVDSEIDTLYHQRAIKSFLNGLGYNTEFIHEGMAAVYSALSDNEFTGLGISFGAGMTNVCLSYYAVPVMQFSITRGGDWIDSQAAKATGKSQDRITAIKEDTLALSTEMTIDGAEGALAVYYDSLVEYLIEMIRTELDEEDVNEDLDIPVIITGGTTLPDGFVELFKRHLASAALPLSISDVRHVDEPMYTVAKGTLIAAQSDPGPSDAPDGMEQRSGRADVTENADWTFDF